MNLFACLLIFNLTFNGATSVSQCQVDSLYDFYQFTTEIEDTCNYVEILTNNVPRIPYYALTGRSAMTSLIFGKGNVTNVEDGAFTGSSLQTLRIEENQLTTIPRLWVLMSITLAYGKKLRNLI